MNTPSLGKHKKNRGQAIVEFMLVLPVLLVLIYGIIEVGRLIFIFSSVANASRQAARYGAGSGEVNNITFYQDCDGIRDTANGSGFIIVFDDINITYDRGLNPDGTQIPIAGIDPDPSEDSCPVQQNVIRNGDRIIVQVSAIYEPVISILPIKPIRIVSASARSFLISIPIVGSALPTGFAAETSTPSKVPPVNTLTFTPGIPPTPGRTYAPVLTNTVDPNHPPTITPLPTLTSTPTQTPPATFTPSITPTFISCSGLTGVSHGPLTIKDNVMQMDIDNNTGHVLITSQVYVEWNHDKGHSGDDTGLRLRQVMFAGQAWDGDVKSPSTYVIAYYPFIPMGKSQIQFVFHQNYNLPDGTERIIVTIGTPGCINYPVDSRN